MTHNQKSILFLAHRVPFPPNKGDKIRTFNEIKYLSRSFAIDLMALADDPKDLGYTSDLDPFCRSVDLYSMATLKAKISGVKSLISGDSISQGYFFQNEFYKQLTKLMTAHDYHAIFCFSSPMAQYLFKFFGPDFFEPLGKKDKRKNQPRLVMDFCDVDSEKWTQYATHFSFPMNWIYKIESRRLLAFEKKINTRFDASVFVSKLEANLFKRLVPDAIGVDHVTNGVDHVYFSPGRNFKKPANSTKILMFPGVMDYHANVEAVLWFCKKVLPLVLVEQPDLRFDIVGNNPTKEVRALAKESHIRVTGFVEDIRPYYEAADVCVIPLKIARGIQNKVLEAMAMARPVVATSAAIKGIDAVHGSQVRKADDPKTFAKEVLDLIRDTETAKETGRAARQFVKKSFSWETSMGKLKDIVLDGL